MTIQAQGESTTRHKENVNTASQNLSHIQATGDLTPPRI